MSRNVDAASAKGSAGVPRRISSEDRKQKTQQDTIHIASPKGRRRLNRVLFSALLNAGSLFPIALLAKQLDIALGI